jgi:hypothetical protein
MILHGWLVEDSVKVFEAVMHLCETKPNTLVVQAPHSEGGLFGERERLAKTF